MLFKKRLWIIFSIFSGESLALHFPLMAAVSFSFFLFFFFNFVVLIIFEKKTHCKWENQIDNDSNEIRIKQTNKRLEEHRNNKNGTGSLYQGYIGQNNSSFPDWMFWGFQQSPTLSKFWNFLFSSFQPNRELAFPFGFPFGFLIRRDVYGSD